MQLTRAADYAVRVMVHLAGLTSGARATKSQLAASGDVPEAFVGKILQALSRGGLITSHRGSVGGFTLARPADSVTLLDVVELMEGPLQLNACLGPNPSCGRLAWCCVHDVWARAQEALAGVLRGVTIASLAQATANRELSGGRREWN